MARERESFNKGERKRTMAKSTHTLGCVVIGRRKRKHYYQSGVQFTNLNHYGTLKMK
jgi:hypothetical protein